jgi:hypothetical protein
MEKQILSVDILTILIHRQFFSKPEVVISLHTQEISVEEAENVEVRGRRKVIERCCLASLAKRCHSISGYNLVKRRIIPIYTNKYKAGKY